MSLDEAKKYYGEKLCNLLIKIYDFCKQSEYIIYQHATDIESADNIMKKGFICSSGKIDNIPSDILQSNPIDQETDESGIKTIIYAGGQAPKRMSGIRDELADTQHFFENKYCNLNFGDLTDPIINRSGFGATCIFVVPKDFSGSREFIQYGVVESYYDDWEEREVPEEYFKRNVIPRQFCIGYLDVNNRRFVANPDFQFNYGITDEFALGAITPIQRDLSVELNNNIRHRI